MQKIKDLTQQWGQDIKIGEKNIEVRVTIEVLYDEMFDLSDYEPKDQFDLLNKINSYKLTPVVIQVLGHVEGHLFGIDSLGGVLMEKKSDIDDIIKDHNMIENCLKDSQKSLTDFLKKVS